MRNYTRGFFFSNKNLNKIWIDDADTSLNCTIRSTEIRMIPWTIDENES